MRPIIRILLAGAIALGACKKDEKPKDRAAPAVTGFTVPALSRTAEIPITAFTASDDVAVTGYLVTESSTPPLADDAGWSATPPPTHAVAADGTYTLRAWARDAGGNVSAPREATVTVDTTAPEVTAFTVPAASPALAVAIGALTASDAEGVAGYLVTDGATAPSPDDARWSATPPASFTLSGPGAHVLRAWAKDAAGNVSAPGTASVHATLRVTVLFTTDEHARLFAGSPEVDDWPLATSAGTGSLVGGVARIAAVLEVERADAALRSADTITVSAGDFSQGTLASAAFLAFAPDLRVLSALGYDAVALGNHEFDLGPTALAGVIYGALSADRLPPLVLTNAFFDATSTADDALEALYGAENAVAPTRVIQTAGGVRVGVVAAMGLGAGIASAAAAPVAFWDPAAETPEARFASIAATVQAAVTSLRADAGVDAVVVLGHGGIGHTAGALGDDELLAASVSGIDLLVSGHTHLAMPAPIEVEDPDGRLVPVVQPRAYGAEVGRVELVFDGGARPALEPARTAFLAVNDTILPSEDPAILGVLQETMAFLEAGAGGSPSFLERALSHVEGTTVVDDPATLGDLWFRPLCETSVDVVGLGFGETNGMNLDTDAMLWTARAFGPTLAGLQNRGSIRGDLRTGRTGAVTFADVFNVVPLGGDPTVVIPDDPAGAAAALTALPGYPLARFWMSTAELRAALEASLLQATRDPDFFVGPSGLAVEYDPARVPRFDVANPLGPGWVTRIAAVDEEGVETALLYDVSQPGTLGTHFLGDPSALQPIVTTYYVASFAQLAGVTLRDENGVEVTAAEAILRRQDGSAVKDHEALAAYVLDQCAQNGGTLPERYADPVPRRMVAPPQLELPVAARSRARFELAGTTWTVCYENDPEPGKSYFHAWSFGTSTATIVHDVHVASLDCTGDTDPAEHFEVTMPLALGSDRTVGWQQPAPEGQPATVTATAFTVAVDAPVPKGVAYVDDTATPPLLFLTNPGDDPPPVGPDGHPTELPNLFSALQ